MSQSVEDAAWHWIETQDEFRWLLAQLVLCSEIALDTEFHREKTYYPKLALLQIGWSGGVALIDPFLVDLSQLKEVFSSPVEVVLHAGTQDLDILARTVGGLPQSIFDTQIAAGFVGFSNPSLAALTERILGLNLPKGDRLTDWTRRPLSDGQLRYAAADVAHLVELKNQIEKQLEEMDRLEWARDESRLLLARDRSESPPERAWWKIKEGRHLHGPSRKVAQQLAAWRELRAARLDIPPRYVLSDLAVAAIAQDLPQSSSALSALRGVDSRFLANGVDREILSVVQSGRNLADEELCVPANDERAKRLKPVASLAVTWVAQMAQTLKIDPLLLATRSDIEAFLNGDRNARLSDGWRNAVLGEPILKLSRGEFALAVNGYGELVLEPRIGPPSGR